MVIFLVVVVVVVTPVEASAKSVKKSIKCESGRPRIFLFSTWSGRWRKGRHVDSERKGTTMIYNLQPMELSQLNHYIVRRLLLVCVRREGLVRSGWVGGHILIKRVVVEKSMLIPLRTNVQNLLYHLSPQKVHFYLTLCTACVVILICMGTPV